jgi:competence protein ComEC
MKKNLFIWILVLLLMPGISACTIPQNKNENESVSILFINVGKADSTLIIVGEKAWLIDTGSDSSTPKIKSALEYFSIKQIEGVFLTHTHGDHIGGFASIAASYDIKVLYCSKIYENNNISDTVFENLAEDFSVQLVKLNTGAYLRAGQRALFEIIGPLEYNSHDDNDNSLVIRFSANGKRILFAGDMQFPEENTLINAGTDLSADILKVGNHGNPDATSENFAEAVNPEIAVISTNTNVDPDSANLRVINLFQDSQIFLTQNYNLGLLVSIDQDGKMSISDL